MFKIYLLSCLIFLSISIFGQFEPAPNEQGTIAIHKDSTLFLSWANQISLFRGKENILDNLSPITSFGEEENALNKAEGNSMDVVSLGDSGVAILSFPNGISDGQGYDFAVFENAFDDHLLELAFVEVSSNGVYFARFPNRSFIPLDNQLTGFEYSNCSYVNNLAGKYRQGYGTPFDLNEIQDTLIDKNHITHVKIIDVIGDISGSHTSYDSEGEIINDPFPTPYPSSGFDLDAIGVINEAKVELFENNSYSKSMVLFPNPAENELFLQNLSSNEIKIFNLQGKLIYSNINNLNSNTSIDINWLKKGLYFLKNGQHGILFEKK
ncbi:MAG: T9SS type A sorting domain-containing protein [Flavobacteriia bacterium]|nr:T9SS type A sorting domain-containing protein [Flavobacteriia bacterium]